jgi:outer membrane putative beta-barrel porin/alpha-amylase
MLKAFITLAISVSIVAPMIALADDAAVLPKGRFGVGLEDRFFLPTDQRYGPDGKAEDLAEAFNHRRLDSSVFPSLAALNGLVLGGVASIGDSSVHFEYSQNLLLLTAAYGVTDRLSIGFEIPYYWVHNEVDASLNSGPGSTANVGLRTGPGPGPCAAPVPVLPLTCPNTRRFTTEDVQQILGPGLPGIQGFGLKRIENFSAEGLGDITLAAKYQYLRTEDWRLAATVGVRMPTGRQDDPDNLADIAWSTGAWILQARLHNDYIISNLWKSTPTAATATQRPLGAGDMLLNLTLRYDWLLPDRVTIRAGEENALPTSRAKVTRDIGDRFEIEFGGRYYIWAPFSVSALYRYIFKLEDRVDGPEGFPHNLAEKDTDSHEHIYIVQANYSTVPLYAQGRFPIPMNVFVSYRDRFAGAGTRASGSPSQVLKTQYIGLGIQVFF